MTKHTPGPWQYQFEGGTTAFIVESNGTTVAAIRVTENSTAHSRFAHNVRLMSAAPDLLDALCMVLDDPDALDDRPRTYECVREAIAKATGPNHD